MADALVATRYTFDFVRRSLPAGAARILEIGCGRGELAAALKGAGLAITAIDDDPQAVEAAKVRGVNARVASWPAELGSGYDAVLFTRSLHHIEQLDDAVAAAAKALRKGGRIIVEDFRAEGGSERSGRWFLDLGSQLIASGELTGTSAETLAERIAPADRDHHLHSSTAIERALERIGHVEASDAAYYFRYLEPFAAHAAAIFERELEAIANGTIYALGKRFVVSV